MPPRRNHVGSVGPAHPTTKRVPHGPRRSIAHPAAPQRAAAPPTRRRPRRAKMQPPSPTRAPHKRQHQHDGGRQDQDDVPGNPDRTLPHPHHDGPLLLSPDAGAWPRHSDDPLPRHKAQGATSPGSGGGEPDEAAQNWCGTGLDAQPATPCTCAGRAGVACEECGLLKDGVKMWMIRRRGLSSVSTNLASRVRLISSGSNGIVATPGSCPYECRR